MKQRLTVKSIFFILSVLAAKNFVAAEEQDTVELLKFEPTSIKAPFIEQFTSSWKDKWVVSESKKDTEGESDELLQYRGKWNVEEPIVYKSIEGDMGLVVKTEAAHHAISSKFEKEIDNEGKTLVVQYEVKLQNDLECGGAYMKLIQKQDTEFDAKKYNDKTPYVIMFGPDRCGATNKVHFIFRHKNPITGKYEEKHYDSPPTAKMGKTTSLYTLIVRPDNTFTIKINNEISKEGNLLEDFVPPVNPPKEIDDPNDKKPSDWVDEAKIPDPDATKPEDWDEDAPEMIVDEDAVKPSDWLDDEPETIDDPEAKKPEDWDDEDDGEWVPVQIPNPKCETNKCGEWKRPMKRNPEYKGKWKAPMIDNPKYIGVWMPKKIPNPNYYEDNEPHNFEPMVAIGFELWTMQNQIMFDNIYIGHNENDAEKFAEETWVKKNMVEMKEVEKEKPKKEDDFDNSDLSLKEKLGLFFNEFKEEPMTAIKAHPKYAAISLILIILPIISVFFIGRPKRKTLEEIHKKDDDAMVDEEKEAEVEEEKEEEEKVEEEEEETSGLKERKNAESKEDDE